MAVRNVDAMFGLAVWGLAASGFAALAGSGQIDGPVFWSCAAAFLLSFAVLAGWVHVRLPPAAKAAAAGAIAGVTLIGIWRGSLTVPHASLQFLVLVSALQLIQAKTSRDFLLAAALALLEMAAGAFLSWSAGFLACLGIFLVCGIAALASGEMRRNLHRPVQVVTAPKSRLSWRLAALSCLASVIILGITAALFFLLPRTARELADRLPANAVHLSGFGSQVGLNAIGRIKKDDRPVIHVKSYSPVVPLNMKWRGNALSVFDGKTWSEGPADRRVQKIERGTVAVADDWQRRRLGTRILYRVELNGIDSETLFVAGTPEFLNVGNGRLLHSAAATFRLIGSGGRSLKYEVSSFLEPGRAGQTEPRTWNLSPADRARFLRLPPVDLRIYQLARNDTAGAGSDADRAALLEKHLRSDYGYTLDLPATEPRDPLAHFLFTRRQGHCEYFASAMTVMLRTLGIPARLVDGFQSGAYNPYSGLLVLRASDAHTWVEAFLEGRGWTTFDPTPFGVPEDPTTFAAKSRLWLDAADTLWREWVLGYDLSRQVKIAGGLNDQAAQWASRASSNARGWFASPSRLRSAALVRTAALLASALLLFLLFRFRPWLPLRRRPTPGDLHWLYAKFLKTLGKRGLPQPSWNTPDEVAKSLAGSPLGGPSAAFIAAYQRARYGGETADTRELRRLLAAIESR